MKQKSNCIHIILAVFRMETIFPSQLARVLVWGVPGGEQEQGGGLDASIG